MPIAFIGPTKMPLLVEQNVFLQNLSCCNIILIFSSSKAMRMNHYCRSDHRLNSCWLNPDAKVLLGAWQTLSHPKTITFSQSLYLAGKSEIVTILSHQKTMPQSHNLSFLPEKSNLSFFGSSSIVKIKRLREWFCFVQQFDLLQMFPNLSQPRMSEMHSLMSLKKEALKHWAEIYCY